MNDIYNELNNLENKKADTKNPVLEGSILIKGNVYFDKNKKYSFGTSKKKNKKYIY